MDPNQPQPQPSTPAAVPTPTPASAPAAPPVAPQPAAPAPTAVAPQTPTPAPPAAEAARYVISEDLKLFKDAFHLIDGNGQLALVAEAKALTLKDNIQAFSDEAKTQPVFSIKEKNLFGTSTTWEVLDPAGKKLGAFKLNRLKSFISQKWEISNGSGQTIGTISQDAKRSLLGKFLANGNKPGEHSSDAIVPQQFKATINGQVVCNYNEEFSRWIYKMDIIFNAGPEAFDRTLGLAGAVLLATRQKVHTSS